MLASPVYGCGRLRPYAPHVRSGRVVGVERRSSRRLVTLASFSKAVVGSSGSGSICGAPAVRVSGRSELQASGGGHHWCAPGVDGGDDLFGVDALQVDRGGAEVGVAELALDDVERHALAGELEGVCVAQLVRRAGGTRRARWRSTMAARGSGRR